MSEATLWARPANRSEAFTSDPTDSYTIIRVGDLVPPANLHRLAGEPLNKAWHVLYNDKNGVETTYATGLTLAEAKTLAKNANS